MARALYGYVGGTPRHMVEEVTRLRLRVRDLEDEVARLRAQQEDAISLELRELSEAAEPALI